VEHSTAARSEQRGGKGRVKEVGACHGAWPLNKKKKGGAGPGDAPHGTVEGRAPGRW
jgi:hypothetical protein